MRPDAYARLQASAAANYVAGEGAYTPYEYQASLAPSMVHWSWDLSDTGGSCKAENGNVTIVPGSGGAQGQQVASCDNGFYTLSLYCQVKVNATGAPSLQAKRTRAPKNSGPVVHSGCSTIIGSNGQPFPHGGKCCFVTDSYDSTLENKYAVLLNKTCAKVLSTVPVRHTCRHVPRACSPCLLHISCTHARFIFLEPHPRISYTSTFLCTMVLTLVFLCTMVLTLVVFLCTMVLTLVFPDRCCPPRTLPTS